MKALFFFLFLQLITRLAFCQIDSGSLKALEAILREQHSEGILYYTDKLDSATVTWIKGALQKRTLRNIGIVRTHVKIRLSRKEKKYLDSNINALYSFCWKDSLFKYSKRISVDSMWTHIHRKNQEVSKLAKEANKYSLNNLVRMSNTFQFSFPVYFRNRAVFLLYFIRMCGGLCGVKELAFYKLEKGGYKKWIFVDGGEF